MKIAKFAYLVGTISFGIMCGFGHLMFELLGEKSPDILDTLQSLKVSLPGRETNMLLLDTGLSLVMGLMLLAYGVINLMMILDGKKIILPTKSIMLANIIFSFSAFILVYNYLFSIPIFFTFIAFICFVIAYVQRLRIKI